MGDVFRATHTRYYFCVLAFGEPFANDLGGMVMPLRLFVMFLYAMAILCLRACLLLRLCVCACVRACARARACT